jgi:RNA polymerase sigma factor (sigma-70 family)
MNEWSDGGLLREYADAGSERAFEELLHRYIDFVYSAALRMVVDPHLAEDVTQAVFVALSRQARNLAGRPVISGWLHRTARNLAAKAVRSEVRRREREQEAIVVQTSEQEPIWKRIAPVLDSALGQLSDADRDAILLRFFEHKTAAEIGARMKLSEEAAQKRVTRALEKLRVLLDRRGVCLSATALGAALGTEAVAAAPAVLLSAVSATALANAPAGIGITLWNLFTMKFKTCGITALIVAGVATPLAIHHKFLLKVREENRWLQARATQNMELFGQTEALSNQLARAEQAQSLTKAQLSELLRLRSEVSLLRRESQELARLRAEQNKPAAANPEGANPFLPATAWANVGTENPQGALQTFFWAGKHEATNLMADLIRVQRDPDIPQSEEFEEMFAKNIVGATSWFSGSLEGFRVLSEEKDGSNMMQLGIELMDKNGKASKHNVRFVREENQWFPVMNLWLNSKGNVQAAMDVPRKFRQ